MGSGASVQEKTGFAGKLSYEHSSAELLPCENCKCDLEKLFSCKQCQKNLCSACCVHFNTQHAQDKQQSTTKDDQKVAENRFYLSNLHAKETLNLPTNSTKAKTKKIRCGTVAQNGKLAFLTQLNYDDKFCACCKNTYKWKLCYLQDKPLYVTKRQHRVDESHIFPGDICFVQCKMTLYLTLPCKRKVYKLPVRENFHEAFETPLGNCFGITGFNYGLALSIKIPSHFNFSKWQIQFVDFVGRIYRRVQNDSEGKSLFNEPLFLTSNKEENILFVSDNEKNSVMAFDTRGRRLFEYHGIALVSPLGIAADMYNNVYVACGKRIILIESGGARSKELLTWDGKDNIVSVCMDHVKNTLYTISEWGHVSSFVFEST